MVDLRSCASLIAQDFADALELFRKWRTKRGGKRDVGQEECENSLHEGSIAVEQTLTRLSQQYGAGFDRGDSNDKSSDQQSLLIINSGMYQYHEAYPRKISRRRRRSIDSRCGREATQS